MASIETRHQSASAADENISISSWRHGMRRRKISMAYHMVSMASAGVAAAGVSMAWRQAAWRSIAAACRRIWRKSMAASMTIAQQRRNVASCEKHGAQ